ncbi:MAG: transposase, partial [Heyndrickxia sp.]
MKIIVIDHNGIKKYILLDQKDTPVIPVIKYLKYLSNIGRTENTLKSYAYHLKLYFKFLEEKKFDYQEINL